MQDQLFEANEKLADQFRQIQAFTEDVNALQDAMALKTDEIENLKRENTQLTTAFAQQKASFSMCSPHETKPSVRDPAMVSFAASNGMEMNLDIQAKMIEELIMKNNQLSDENTAQLHMKGPFQGSSQTDSAGEGIGNFQSYSSSLSHRDNQKLNKDDTFAVYANLKSIEYIHTQFYAQKNSREAVLDTKNACFSDLYSLVDDLVKKMYNLFV